MRKEHKETSQTPYKNTQRRREGREKIGKNKWQIKNMYPEKYKNKADENHDIDIRVF